MTEADVLREEFVHVHRMPVSVVQVCRSYNYGDFKMDTFLRVRLLGMTGTTRQLQGHSVAEVADYYWKGQRKESDTFPPDPRLP